ncbi:hypothetical protein V494_07792 [Pseudogymnoascus sp. VKM F-4513 (FW-928)]|nr:hypothetical protein V494_07792 [Pseudogymnoascus sp. VKM F-4513 (FW-928)]
MRPEEPVETALNQAREIFSASSEEILRTIEKFFNILIIHSEEESAKIENLYPLSIHYRIRQDAIQIKALFDSRLLGPETVHMMLFQFRHAFQSIVQSPKALLNSLQGCCPEGIQKIIQWNAETAPECIKTLGHELIEQRCREQPSAQALASILISAGIGPDRFVGLLMEKSMWTTVAILAVMKAGGCFYLLDASQPMQRLSLMCGKAQPRVILISAIHQAIADALDVPSLIVPRDIPSIDISSPELQTPSVQPHQRLYAGFTSGSTGEPKGFVIDQVAFSSGLRAYCAQSELTADSRVLQFASYSFIVSVTDQIAPLTQGACICVPSEDNLQNDLSGAINRLKANWAKLTPSVLSLLAPSDVPELSTLIVVGEAMDAVELATWQLKGISLSSLYGVSENSKGGMFGSLNDPGCDVRHFARPFGATPWVVDRHDPNILLPIGAEGELLLEGPCVSRGYIDNEEQNQMTFLWDPAWLRDIRSDGKGRFLRTGDLVRYNAKDGTLYMLGRKGTRVKIRGQRIELAEIEHHLRFLFDSKERVVVEVVVPSDDTAKNPMLVAFVPVGEQKCSLVSDLFLPPKSDFRDKAQGALSNLRDILPSFMVPSTVISTLTLPRTPTGKLHRRMLRETASKLSRKELLAYISIEATHQAPTTELEIILLQVCCQVLNLPSSAVSMQANFFDLGGNSITARRLVTLARESGLSVAVADVFRQSSLSNLAGCHRECSDGAVLEDIDTDPFESIRNEFLANIPAPWTVEQIEDVLPTLEEQEYMANIHELDYHLFELTGPVDITQLRHACQALVDHHAILRSIYLPFRQTILQVNLRHVTVPFTLHAPTDQDDAEIWAKSFCDHDQQQTCRVDEPRIEFNLVQDAPEHGVLVLRLPHAQYDATCLTKLVTDLWAAYENRDIHIASNFTTFIHKCFQQKTPRAYGFWKDVLLNSHITPSSFENIPVTDEKYVVFEREIPRVTPPKGITMATVIKAAWAKLIEERTGRSDLVFGQYISNRNFPLPAVDDIVGPCVNLIPMRVETHTDSGTVNNLLQTIQTQYAESISFESLGWKDIARTCTQWPVPPMKQVYFLAYPLTTSLRLVLESSNALLRKDESQRVLARLEDTEDGEAHGVWENADKHFRDEIPGGGDSGAQDIFFINF